MPVTEPQHPTMLRGNPLIKAGWPSCGLHVFLKHQTQRGPCTDVHSEAAGTQLEMAWPVQRKRHSPVSEALVFVVHKCTNSDLPCFRHAPLCVSQFTPLFKQNWGMLSSFLNKRRVCLFIDPPKWLQAVFLLVSPAQKDKRGYQPTQKRTTQNPVAQNVDSLKPLRPWL